MNKTKIIATLGPASQAEEQIIELIEAGMDIARINLSHGERSNHEALIRAVENARSKVGSGTAILLDTRGPEIRVGNLESGISLVEGQFLTLCCQEIAGTYERIGVNYCGLAEDVVPGDKIFLDDGKITLQVENVTLEGIHTRVLNSGNLSSRKRVSLPGIKLNLPSLSRKDEEDIRFGIEAGVDFIAASFVRSADDVWAVRRIIEEMDGFQAIIAKIENRQGIDKLDEIIEAADGLMVARGDLGVEVAAEEVPVIQKQIIKKANHYGKPVITATQMLESMISSPSPTRAEASDITNAIFDGTDAIMLSAETAVGQYPLEAVRFMARCAVISESSLDYEAILTTGLQRNRGTIADAISYASCASASDLKAKAILTATTSGSTARMVARYRPEAPIIAVGNNTQSLRKLQLVRGVIPLFHSPGMGVDNHLDNALISAIQEGLVKNGDLVVITAGLPLMTSGTTNFLKIVTVADSCYIGQGIGHTAISGTIRIIKKKEDWKNLPEDVIIVVHETDHTMLDKLLLVKGIIAEQPGLTSHAAIVGRELKIPVVCGVKDAMKSFQNDQLVNIDANTGQVCHGQRS